MSTEATNGQDATAAASDFALATDSASQEGEDQGETQLILQLLLEYADALATVQSPQGDKLFAELVEYAQYLGWQPKENISNTFADEPNSMQSVRVRSASRGNGRSGRAFERQNCRPHRTASGTARRHAYSSTLLRDTSLQRAKSAPPAKVSRVAPFLTAEISARSRPTPAPAKATAAPVEKTSPTGATQASATPAPTRGAPATLGVQSPAGDLAKAPIQRRGILPYLAGGKSPEKLRWTRDAHVESALRDREKLAEAASVLESLEDRDALLLCRIKQRAVTKVIRELYGVQWDGEMCLIECLVSRAYAAVGYQQQAKQHLETAAAQVVMLAGDPGGVSREQSDRACVFNKTTDVAIEEAPSGMFKASQTATDFVELGEGRNGELQQPRHFHIRRGRWGASGTKALFKSQTSQLGYVDEKSLASRFHGRDCCSASLAAKVQSVCAHKKDISFDLLGMEFFHSLGDVSLAEDDAASGMYYFRLAIDYAQRVLTMLHSTSIDVGAADFTAASSEFWKVLPLQKGSESCVSAYERPTQELLSRKTGLAPAEKLKGAFPDVGSLEVDPTVDTVPEIQCPREAPAFCALGKLGAVAEVEPANLHATCANERQPELLQTNTKSAAGGEMCPEIRDSLTALPSNANGTELSGEEATAALKLHFRRAELLLRLVEASLELQGRAALRESQEAVQLFLRLTGSPDSLRSLQARYLWAQALHHAGYVQEAYEAFVAIIRRCVDTEDVGSETRSTEPSTGLEPTVSSIGELKRSTICSTSPSPSSLEGPTVISATAATGLHPPVSVSSSASSASAFSTSSSGHESFSIPPSHSADTVPFDPLSCSVSTSLTEVQSVLSRLSTEASFSSSFSSSSSPPPPPNSSSPSSSLPFPFATSHADLPWEAGSSAGPSLLRQQRTRLLLRCALAVEQQVSRLPSLPLRREARGLLCSVFRALAIPSLSHMKKLLRATNEVTAAGNDDNCKDAKETPPFFLSKNKERHFHSQNRTRSALARSGLTRILRDGVGEEGEEEDDVSSFESEGETRLFNKKDKDATENHAGHVSGGSPLCAESSELGVLLSQLGNLLIPLFTGCERVEEEEKNATIKILMEYTELKYGKDSEQLISLLLQKAEHHAARGQFDAAIADSERALEIMDDHYLFITSRVLQKCEHLLSLLFRCGVSHSEKAMAEKAKTLVETYTVAQKHFSKLGVTLPLE